MTRLNLDKRWMHGMAMTLIASVLVTACAAASHSGDGTAAAPTSEATTEPVPGHVRAAVSHPERPDEDRARDPDRQPGRALTFFGIEPGMQVAELMAGRGYYAELLAHAVGPEGTVYAHNTSYVLDKFARGPLEQRLAKPSLKNAVSLEAPLESPGLPQSELDAVLMILFYHDTYWMDVDRNAMNAAIYAALKPGGVFGVVDHYAREGAGTEDVKTLHRVEPEIVTQEIVAAGFELEARSRMLRHPQDSRTHNVFDPEIRGKTDRFVLRFRKPK